MIGASGMHLLYFFYGAVVYVYARVERLVCSQEYALAGRQ